MNPGAVAFLCCPADRGALRLECAETDRGRVIQGQLSCEICDRTYLIRDAIPRFVPDSDDSVHDSIQGAIAENFGRAWQLYARDKAARTDTVNPYTEEQFLDWIFPLEPVDFAGKIVLDLGSGLGGFSSFAAGYGASQVIGLDISQAVDAAIPLLWAHPNLTFVQGNLLQPPIRPNSIDLGYSIGVLHHLEAPRSGCLKAAELIQRGGQLFIWVYGRENNGLVVHVVDPLRKVLSKLPVGLVRTGIAFPMSLVLFPLLHTLYHPALKRLSGQLPYYDYFQWLRRYGFGYVVGMVTDQLIPPRTHYHRREELQGWAAEAGLSIESMTHRNAMSWRMLVRK